jgi:hypothetical protein
MLKVGRSKFDVVLAGPLHTYKAKGAGVPWIIYFARRRAGISLE